jgi:hypothetical protein
MKKIKLNVPSATNLLEESLIISPRNTLSFFNDRDIASCKLPSEKLGKTSTIEEVVQRIPTYVIVKYSPDAPCLSPVR